MNAPVAGPHPSGVSRTVSCLLLVALVLLSTFLHAQVSEADKKKRDAFLKAREEMRTVGSPTPSQSPSAKPKPATKKKKSQSGKTADEADRAEPAKSPTPRSKARAN
ncbi:MAG: hypothetical protein ABI883_03170, partial [Chthoniobacterales bacterium]